MAGVVAAHVPEPGADGERQTGGQQAVRVLQGLPAAGARQLPPVQCVALRPRHLHAVHLLLHRHRLQPGGPGRSVSQSFGVSRHRPLAGPTGVSLLREGRVVVQTGESTMER